MSKSKRQPEKLEESIQMIKQYVSRLMHDPEEKIKRYLESELVHCLEMIVKEIKALRAATRMLFDQLP